MGFKADEARNESWSRGKVTGPLTKRRLICAIAGGPGSGKTTFALSAPGPIAYMDVNEGGYEGVMDPFVEDGKEIVVNTYNYNHLIRKNDFQATAEAVNEVWSRFVRDYKNAVKSFRSVVVDTADRPWEMLRLARFGKAAEIPPFLYRVLNPEFERLVDWAKDGNANVIFLVRTKREYVNTFKMINGEQKEVSNPAVNKDGSPKMQWTGYKALPFLVHMDAEMTWTPRDGFTMTVGTKCRQNAALRGKTIDLPEQLLTFPQVASLVFKGTEPEDWE